MWLLNYEVKSVVRENVLLTVAITCQIDTIFYRYRSYMFGFMCEVRVINKIIIFIHN